MYMYMASNMYEHLCLYLFFMYVCIHGFLFLFLV